MNKGEIEDYERDFNSRLRNITANPDPYTSIKTSVLNNLYNRIRQLEDENKQLRGK